MTDSKSMQHTHLIIVTVVPFTLKAFWIALETVWCSHFATWLIRLVWTYHSTPLGQFLGSLSPFDTPNASVLALFLSLPLKLNAQEFILWFGGLIWAKLFAKANALE
ncbi:hypothetical protein HD554DRAFT_2165619 [Boletus coccyginus]|nr:hypothetical protein HD554DRAFT_2165619 [Boletus coccyginus]